ncbi:MAG: AAA family ATPase [Nitriliruptorales bacterium]|nr:AAA family ATPase [Nitriliruptorales bacterium]
MAFYADLHIHSKYSRATSRDCDLEHLAWWAGRKGIGVVGTGDFTHPAWFAELGEHLVPAEPGLFRLHEDLERDVHRRLPPSCRGPVRFMLSVEISTIYKKGERTRKVHHLVYAPDFDTAAAINRKLGAIGNIASDGRPILGLDSRHLLELTLESGDGAYLVPAHVWTPWFAVLGSKSGFDAVEDCYDDLAGHIFAVETGLSSDPLMNWRVSGLDRYRLVSNSDAHSPPMLGREASVFGTDVDYFAMRAALQSGDGYRGSIEFFPEEGKYHLDGHRACGIRLEPTETRQRDGACPGCGKPLTVGVLHRVEALADRPEGARPEGAAGFRSLVPLAEIVGEIRGVGPKSKTVAREVTALIDRLGPELPLLERLPLAEIGEADSPVLVEAIDRLRRGQVIREAGFDGEYGVIRMFEEAELRGPATVALALDDLAPAAGNLDGSRQGRSAAADRPTLLAPPPDGPLTAADASEASGASPPVPGTDVAQPLFTGSAVLDGLDPQQRAAAAITEGPLLVVAGPGTGKTRTLTHRLAHLIGDHGVPPERCLAITFTRRACEELEQRLAGLLPGRASRLLVTTFHGLGWRIIREHHESLGLPADVRVADEPQRLELVRALLGGSEREARRRLTALSEVKRAPATTLGADADAGAALASYDRALRERALVDFDDLTSLPVRLLEADADLAAEYRTRHQWIAIDEYQDVDELQYRLVRLLAPPEGNLCAIGDPDQAIYGFRGADVGFFLRFHQDFPTARSVRLVRNYRSNATIVDAAVQAIAPSTLVPDRALAAVRQDDPPQRIVVHDAPSARSEAEFVVHTIDQLLGGSSYFSMDSGRVHAGDGADLCFADFAVLYRTGAQAEPLIEALERAGMPFQKRSHDRLVDRPGVQAILQTLSEAQEAAEGEPPITVLIRIHEAAKNAIGTAEAEAPGTPGGDRSEEIRAALDLLEPLAERCEADLRRFLSELALGAEVDTWDPRADRVSLLTLHAAKGLEFPVVFLVGCEDGLLPLRWDAAGGDDDADAERGAEERRLFFVGMTRARSRLFLTRARRRARHGSAHDTRPSPFLADLQDVLLERLHAEHRPPKRQRSPAGDQLRLL